MNGEDKQFWEQRIQRLEQKITKANHLKVQFETWLNAHDKSAEDRKKSYCEKFDVLFDKVDSLQKSVNDLPCNVHLEKIKDLEKIEDSRAKNKIRIWLVAIGLFVTIFINVFSFVTTYAHFQERVKNNSIKIEKITEKINHEKN